MDEPKRAVILEPQRMQPREYVRQDWAVAAAENTTVEDVLNAQYWSHMASKMKPYDRIEVALETGEWILELVVLACERNWAKVHLLEKHDIEPPSDSLPIPVRHRVKWRGPQHKHSVVRLADGAVVQDGFEDPEVARAWMRDHEAKTL